MGVGCRELITADEPAVVTEPLFDAIVVEGGQGYGCLTNPSGTDQRDWCEVLCETNGFLDQLSPAEADPWWWWR